MERAVLELLKSRGLRRRFAQGDILFAQGDRAREMYYLESGLSLTYTTDEEGRERNILISWPGRIFGASTLFEPHARRASAVALKPCEVIVIPKALYEECCRRFPTFSDFMIRELSKDIGVLFEELADSALLRADVKVARFLCRRMLKEDPAALRYTQDFIASVLGLSRLSVNQALAAFAERGWLRTGYGVVHVTDGEALRDFAGGALR